MDVKRISFKLNSNNLQMLEDNTDLCLGKSVGKSKRIEISFLKQEMNICLLLGNDILEKNTISILNSIFLKVYSLKHDNTLYLIKMFVEMKDNYESFSNYYDNQDIEHNIKDLENLILYYSFNNEDSLIAYYILLGNMKLLSDKKLQSLLKSKLDYFNIEVDKESLEIRDEEFEENNIMELYQRMLYFVVNEYDSYHDTIPWITISSMFSIYLKRRKYTNNFIYY